MFQFLFISSEYEEIANVFLFNRNFLPFLLQTWIKTEMNCALVFSSNINYLQTSWVTIIFCMYFSCRKEIVFILIINDILLEVFWKSDIKKEMHKNDWWQHFSSLSLKIVKREYGKNRQFETKFCYFKRRRKRKERLLQTLFFFSLYFFPPQQKIFLCYYLCNVHF